MSLYLQIHKERNASKVQDIISSVRRSTNQVNFHRHLHSHSSSLFFSCFYDHGSPFWPGAYSIWCCQCLCACKSEWNCVHENVRQISEEWLYTEAEQNFIWIAKILNLMTAEAEKDSARSKI